MKFRSRMSKKELTRVHHVCQYLKDHRRVTFDEPAQDCAKCPETHMDPVYGICGQLCFGLAQALLLIATGRHKFYPDMFDARQKQKIVTFKPKLVEKQ